MEPRPCGTNRQQAEEGGCEVAGKGGLIGEKHSVRRRYLGGAGTAGVIGVVLQAILHHRNLAQFSHPASAVLVLVLPVIIGLGVAVLVERPRRTAYGPVTAFFSGCLAGLGIAVILI